jgi:hypothetical protein
MRARIMNPLHRRAGRLLATFILGAGAACAAVALTEPPQPAARSRVPQAKLATQPGWVQAPVKAGGSGVLLRYGMPAALNPGQAATVRLQLSRIVAPAGAQVELRAADPALQFTLEGQPVNGPIELSRGEVRELQLQVLAANEGLYRLSVLTRQNGRVSAVSVPIRVGNVPVQAKARGAAVQVTPTGEKVVSLPAR